MPLLSVVTALYDSNPVWRVRAHADVVPLAVVALAALVLALSLTAGGILARRRLRREGLDEATVRRDSRPLLFGAGYLGFLLAVGLAAWEVSGSEVAGAVAPVVVVVLAPRVFSAALPSLERRLTEQGTSAGAGSVEPR